MACYLWYGEDTSLQLQQGVLQARGVSHLGCQLAQQGVQLKRQFRITAWQRRRSAIKPLVACELLQQWQQLLAAGLPLLDCVRLAMPQQPSITLRWQLWLLQDRLQQGHQLSSVFAEQQLLPAYQIALLAAGERQADIGKVMRQLARQQHQTMAIAKQLKRSLLMPAITLAAGLLVCVLMLLFLVPNLASLVQSDQHNIPTATRWLLAISNGLRQSGPQLLLAGALILGLGGLFISSQYGQALARKIPAWLPVWRAIYQLQNECLVMQLLAGSLLGGVPLLSALEQCQQASRSVALARQIHTVRRLLTTGVSLSQAFAQAGAQESQVVMLRLAEHSGNLVAACEHISEQIETRLLDRIDRLSQLLEPLITIILAILVGGLIIAIYLPLMQMGSLL